MKSFAMDEEGNHLARTEVRVRLFETEGEAEGPEGNEVRQRSPAIGSGLDDEDDAVGLSRSHHQRQLGSEAATFSKEEAEDDATDERMEASMDAEEGGTAVEMGSAAMSPDSKGASLNDTEELDDTIEGHTECDLSLDNIFVANSSSHQDDRGATSHHGLADREDGHTTERLNSPLFEGDSISLHDRDPNYATQRPDTLGAINLMPQNVAATSAKVFQNVVLKAGTRFRASGQGNNASEDAIFDMVQLGRRTRGAGMDQVELNQHHQPVGSDNESDSGDAAEPDSNQCESTEADQYKMNPEADQSDSGRPDIAPEAFGGINRLARNGARASGPMRMARSEEGFQVADDDGEEEELQEDSEITEEDDRDWKGLNDQDLADRTEDDRQYSVNDRHAGPVVGGAKGGLPGGWQKETVVADSGSAATGAALHLLQLKHHPNSAFSQLKPEASSGHSAGGQSSLDVGHDMGMDRKPVQNGVEKKLNVVLQSQDQLMSKTAAIFKPIGHENKTNHTGEAGHRAVFPRQYSEGHAAEMGSSFRFGLVTKHGKTQSENGLRSRTDRDDLLIHSPRLLTSNPTFEDGSSESLHGGFFPCRAAHLMHGEPNMAFPLGSSTLGALSQLQQQPQMSGLLYHPLPLGCDYEPQVTPQKQTRSSYQLMEDSLELSPIRPPSSQISQQPHQQPLPHGFIQSPGLASLGDAFRTDRLHSYGYKTSSEHGGEISDIQEVRSHLHSLLTLSDRTIPDKARYDQTNDVDELLTSHSGHSIHDQPTSWNFAGLQEALPLSSKYLLSGANQTKVDVAALAAENRALRDAMEQQRFKRKHCERQIQQLQNKVLELQQNLTVAVSMDRKKDLTIEQMDKALVKVAEGWHQKEAERHEAVVYLQKENSSLKMALDSQQQVTSRLELQLNHSLQQFHLEQQRAAQMCLSKDQHISELMSQCQRLQQMSDSERERWLQKSNDEKREADQMKEKMQLQLQDLKSAHEEELESRSERERESQAKLEQLRETQSKILEAEKVKLDHQVQAYHDLEAVLRATQTEVEQLQLESETMMREKESLKVEMGLMEARHASSMHQLEAELHSAAERKLSTNLEEISRKQIDSERKLHETYRHQLQELTQQHREELEQLKDEHQASVSELEELFHQQQKIRESRIKELEKKVIALEEENKRIETHKLELAGQLQSMMQSHCEEALRLLRFTQPESGLVLTNESWNGNSKNTNGGTTKSIQDDYSSADHLSPEMIQSSARDMNHLQELPSNNSFPMLPLNCGANEDALSRGSSFPSDSQQSASPLSDDATGGRPAYNMTGSVSDSAAGQYLQFLASVRNYQPLLADLNASVASVANSFSTLTQTSHGTTNDNAAEAESGAGARTASAHHVSFQRSPTISPVQLQQYQHQQQQHPTADGHFSSRSQMPSNGADIYLHSPVQLDESSMFGQRQMMAVQQQQQQQHMIAMNQKTKSKDVMPSSSARQKDMTCERIAASSSGDYQQSSLFSQILQHDTTNTSEESAIEYTEETTKDGLNEEPADTTNNRLHQQEQRQQQLHHYIRMLLQRSPGGSSSQDEHPVSNAVSFGQASHPPNRQLTHETRQDSRMNGSGELQRLDGRLSSPEQDHQMMIPRQRDRPTSEGPASHQNPRNTIVTQSDHSNQSAESDFVSRTQQGEVLSQQQLAEISRLLGSYKTATVNPSQFASSPPIPVTDLFGYLKAVCENRTKPSDQQSSAGTTEMPAADHHPKDGVLPRNHPSHPINKELIVVPDATAVKQDSTKHCKSNKAESSKPKNSSSATKASDKKERLPAPKNSNSSSKHAAWK